MRRIGCLLLLALTALAWGQADASYKVLPSSIGAEIVPADSKLMLEAAVLLGQGKTGISTLAAWARSKDAKRSQAARLVLLGSGDLAYLPLLLEGLHPRGTSLFIAFKAIRLYPRQSWPILVRMAEQGNPGAPMAIGLYAERGQPELLRLSESPNAKVRALAIEYVASHERLVRALDDPSLQVRRSAVQRLVWVRGFDYRPYLSEKHRYVRELFAEFAHRWVEHDLTPWFALTKDKSANVRRWALLHMGSVGTDWGSGPFTSKAIQTVHEALVSGPPDVSHPAAMAVRGWLVEWYWIADRWTPAQIAAAEKVFKLPRLRDALYYQALSEGLDDRMGSVEVLGIRMRLALHSLIICQDPRALALAKKVIGKGYPTLIPMLSSLPGPATVNYLFSLIEKSSARRGSVDYNTEQVFEEAIGSLKRLGVHDWSRAVRLLNSPRLEPSVKAALKRSLARVVRPQDLEAPSARL